METKKIAISVSKLKVNTAKHLLEEAGIPCFVMDKMDSSHAMVFGHIEIYVPETDAERAKAILDESDVLE